VALQVSFDRFSHPITLFAEAPGLNCPTFHHCLDLATIGMTEFVRFSIYGGPAIASCASSRFRLTSDAITALHVPLAARFAIDLAPHKWQGFVRQVESTVIQSDSGRIVFYEVTAWPAREDAPNFEMGHVDPVEHIRNSAGC
jgi:hypothetical protein